jgi:chromosome segregation ATPase
VRAQIRGVPDPTQALLAAAQLGEQQGLRAQLAAMAAERDRLSEALAAMTYQVSELESQHAARVAAERTSNTELKRATGQLQATFERLREQLAQPAPTATAALTRLASEVRQLRTDLARAPRARPVRSAARKPKESIRKSLATKSRTSGHPGIRRSRRTERRTRIRPGSRRR